jgi:hypothetical protein
LKVGVIYLGKSLLPDEVRGLYRVEEWHFHAWSKTLVDVLQELNRRKKDLAKSWWKQIFDRGRTEERNRATTAPDYSRMNYEELRKIADNDPVADNMSDEEYGSLSVELWRKFSAEKLAP